jgi:hypothetical protein
MTRLRSWGIPSLLIATLALAGCSGGGSGGASDSAGTASEPMSAAGRNAADGVAAPDGAGAEFSAPNTRPGPDKARPGVQTAAIISTGTVSLVSPDVAKARFELEKVLDTYGGKISDEKTSSDEDGVIRLSRLVVRVPSADFEDAMTDIGKLGDLVESTRKSEDVTTQVIDTEVRVRAQEKSLERIEALLAQARNLRDIIAIESQLTRRQADLDSLKSQQAWLQDQTSLSTIDVYLERKEPAPAVPKKKDHHNAFIGGLISGWNGLSTLGAGLATIFGAALPFIVVLALVGLPLWPVVRRFRPRHDEAVPEG